MLLKIRNVCVLLAIAVFQIANCQNAAFANPQVAAENSFVCWAPLVKQLAYNWNADFIDQFTLLALKQKDVKWLQWLGLDESQAHQLFARIQEIPVFVQTMTPPPVPPASLSVEHPVVFQPPQVLYTWFNHNGGRQLVHEMQFPPVETGAMGAMGTVASDWSAGDPNSRFHLTSDGSQGSAAAAAASQFGSNLRPNINFHSGYSQAPNAGSELSTPSSSQFGFNYNYGSNAANRPESVSGSAAVDPKINLSFGLSPELKSNMASSSSSSSSWSSYNLPSTFKKSASDSGQETLAAELSTESNADVTEPDVSIETVTDRSDTVEADPKNIHSSSSGSASIKHVNVPFDVRFKTAAANENLNSKTGLAHDFNVKFGSGAGSKGVFAPTTTGSEKHFSVNVGGPAPSGQLNSNAKFGSSLKVDSAASEVQADANAESKQSTVTVCAPVKVAASATASEAADMFETAAIAKGTAASGSKTFTASASLGHEKQGHQAGLDLLRNLAGKVKSKMGELSIAANRNVTWSSGRTVSPKDEVEIVGKSVEIVAGSQDNVANSETDSSAKFGTNFDKNVKIETGSSGLKLSSSRNFELGKKSEGGESGMQASSGFKIQLPSIFSAKNRTESHDESTGSGSGSGFGFNRKFSINFGRN